MKHENEENMVVSTKDIHSTIDSLPDFYLPVLKSFLHHLEKYYMLTHRKPPTLKDIFMTQHMRLSNQIGKWAF